MVLWRRPLSLRDLTDRQNDEFVNIHSLGRRVCVLAIIFIVEWIGLVMVVMIDYDVIQILMCERSVELYPVNLYSDI